MKAQETKQNGPLKRNMNKRKSKQREGVTNDVVALHSRRINELSAKQQNIFQEEKVLYDKCQEWKQMVAEFESLEKKLRQTARECVDAVDAAATGKVGSKRKRRQGLNTSEMHTMRLQRTALHSDISTKKSLLVKMQQDIQYTRDNTELIDYQLSAIPFLNTQHAIKSDLMRVAKQLDNPELKSVEKKISLKEQMHRLNQQNRVNSHEYTMKFYPNLVRDIDKTKFDESARAPNVCRSCSGEIIEIENSQCICEDCGMVDQIGMSMNPANNLNWEDMQNAPGRQYTYRRLNHFREYMRQIQGQSRATIPDLIYTELKEEFRKVRMPAHKINPRRVKVKLKKIGRSKYYEHIESIAARLSSTYKPIRIDPVHEEKLCLMFVQLENPFENIKHMVNRDRKNFFSYPFAFFKLNELNGWDEYNRSCSLLKSTELINKQDIWWKLVMIELGWQVIGRTFDIHR